MLISTLFLSGHILTTYYLSNLKIPKKARNNTTRKKIVKMTVQELIDALNKVEDKSKDVVHYDYLEIDEIEECDNDVILY